MKKLTRFVAFSLVVWMTAGVASSLQAQDSSAASPMAAPTMNGKHHHKWACGADIKSLCPDAKTRKDKMKCLKDNKDKVSDECKAKMEKMHSKMTALKEACKADVAQFCADAKGPRAIHQCLKKNKDSLSVSCKAARAKMKKAWKKHHRKHGDNNQSQGAKAQAPSSQPTQQ